MYEQQLILNTKIEWHILLVALGHKHLSLNIAIQLENMVNKRQMLFDVLNEIIIVTPCTSRHHEIKCFLLEQIGFVRTRLNANKSMLII